MIRWSDLAEDDLISIESYIAEDNPTAATVIADRIWTATEILETHPYIGRLGRVEGTRELVVSGTPYIVIYRQYGFSIDILRISHGSQQWGDKKIVSVEDIQELRNNLQNRMPDFMKVFSKELGERVRPDEYSLSKNDYIRAWFGFFAEELLDNERQTEHCINRLNKYNRLQLREAFEWTLEHFAELDLGGNFKWFAVVEDILKNLKNKSWHPEQQQALIAQYLTDTRWY